MLYLTFLTYQMFFVQGNNILLNILVETMISFYTHLHKDCNMKQLSNQMFRLLERLAEMFPKQHYQSELDRYISHRHPQNAADVEHFTKEFEHKYSQGKFI